MSDAEADHPFSLPTKGSIEQHFAQLGRAFYTSMTGEKVGERPQLIHANASAAQLLDLDPSVFQDPKFVEVLSGHRPLEGFSPLAMVYSGHQFGVWAGQLGDGRALLIGQVRNQAGELWDIQLKGAGKTPYSRFGDGRAVLRSCVREYLCSEAMDALSIPTSRALAMVSTGESVRRERLEPGAVLTRLARSHVRFGHFEHFFHRGRSDEVRQLADYVIAEYFPAFKGEYTDWFGEVVRLNAELIAYWQAVGFAHGVMNTDNMSILGLTLDYGPYGFMDGYDPHFVCNHSDEQGRYSFLNQPGVAHWNLRALALALSPLIPTDFLMDRLNNFETHFARKYRTLMRAKLGLSREEEGDDRLIGDLLELMADARADYTLSFRNLNARREDWLKLFGNHGRRAEDWRARYRDRTRNEDLSRLNAINPKYVLRNWVAEVAIRALEDRGDVETFDRIFRLVKNPFEEQDGEEAFAAPPPSDMCDLEVSCSS